MLNRSPGRPNMVPTWPTRAQQMNHETPYPLFMLNFGPWDRPNMLFLATKLAKIGHGHPPNAQHKPRKAQHGPDMTNKMNHETTYPLFMLNFGPWDRPDMAPRPAATGPQQQLLAVEVLCLATKLAKIGHEHPPNAQHKPRKAQHGPDMTNKSATNEPWNPIPPFHA